MIHWQQRNKGCSHAVAVRALAFKWIRILFKVWKTGTPYDESTYLNALKKRRSPLATLGVQPAKFALRVTQGQELPFIQPRQPTLVDRYQMPEKNVPKQKIWPEAVIYQKYRAYGLILSKINL